jgi:hypothetical protein
MMGPSNKRRVSFAGNEDSHAEETVQIKNKKSAAIASATKSTSLKKQSLAINQDNKSFETQKKYSGLFRNVSDPTLSVAVNNHSYLKIGVLGKGGSSCVHRVLSE